jgi:hypothetical protein
MNHDYKAAKERYARMRVDGELAHLTERVYLRNLWGIGLHWHGPGEQPGHVRPPVAPAGPTLPRYLQPQAIGEQT